MPRTDLPQPGLESAQIRAALATARCRDEWFTAGERPEVALTLPSSWDEHTEYEFSMTEALFYCEHPHALDRVLDEVDLSTHRAAVTDALHVSVADFRRSLGEHRWRAFDEALRRRVHQSADGAEFCWRRGYVPDGLDLFTLYELYRRGWVNVFSAKPIELDEAEPRGLDYGDDFNDLAALGDAPIHDGWASEANACSHHDRRRATPAPAQADLSPTGPISPGERFSVRGTTVVVIRIYRTRGRSRSGRDSQCVTHAPRRGPASPDVALSQPRSSAARPVRGCVCAGRTAGSLRTAARTVFRVVR